MFKRKPVKYTPISNDYNYTNKRSYSCKKTPNIIRQNLKYKINIVTVIGVVLSIIGILSVLSRTIVYTPMRFLNARSGISFALSTIIFFIGVALVAANFRSYVGYILIGSGVIVICISIVLSLRMAFTQTSLIKTIFIFSFIIVGFILIIKSNFYK